MDLFLNEEQKAMVEEIIIFSRNELNDGVKQDYANGYFPIEKWKKCAALKIMALPFPKDYSGCNADILTTAVSLKALSYGCKDAGLVHAIATQILCGLQMLHFGSEEQKGKYLPGICNGEIIAAQAITEPNSGSDAFAMQTKAVKCDGQYILNGSKIFITNGPIADVVIVFAVTSRMKNFFGGISCFIAEKDFKGFTRSKALDKMGLRTLQNGELVFESCEIPESNLFGKEGHGTNIFNESMEYERILYPAIHLGTMERIFETSCNYSKERKAFSQSISKFQSISNKIVDMKVNIELGKLILYKSAKLKDMGKRANVETSIGKLFISESLKKTCLEAVQIHGGYGFMTEYEIEKDLRDSIASTIYSGTSELQYSIISRLMGL
jgi:alkylation response protein AidB-like acyl-CoA dehydrogenase